MKKNKTIIKFNKRLIIVLLLLIISVVSGTYAWFTFRTNKTALVLTVGDFNETRVTLSPYQVKGTLTPSSNYYNGLYTQIEAVNVNTYSSVQMELFYKINELSSDFKSDTSGLKYTIVRSENEEDGDHWTTSANPNDVVTGEFSKLGSDNVIFSDLIPAAVRGAQSIVYYRVYLWIDSSVGDQSFLENKILDLELNGNLNINGTVPVLDNNMIPVVLSTVKKEDGSGDYNYVVEAVSSNNPEWYDYNNKKWANVVLVNKDRRNNYKVYGDSKVEVNQSDILAYYVWIPRYKYKIWSIKDAETTPFPIEIQFEGVSSTMNLGTTVSSWRSHPAFWWDDDNDSVVDDGEVLSGIWVGKFESSIDVNETCYKTPNSTNCNNSNHSIRILPNVNSLRYQSTSNMFNTSRQINKFGNEYGLNSMNFNSHMIKNSEWGAVAYLSHSLYGINDEVRINNCSTYITGCGASTVNGAKTTTCQNQYGTVTIYPQSTTGNISGVFDMSGGGIDRVMANYANTAASSGFSSFPSLKYYDKYTTTSRLTMCSSALCFGHALSETYLWYSDSLWKVTTDEPWINRGGRYDGYHDSGSSTYLPENSGIFATTLSSAGAGETTTWRPVLVPNVDSELNVDISVDITNDFSSEQTATFKWNADLDVVNYYIGTSNPNNSNVTWASVPADEDGDGYRSIPFTINYDNYSESNGIYYFALKDSSGTELVLDETVFATYLSYNEAEVAGFTNKDNLVNVTLGNNTYKVVLTRKGNSINLPDVTPVENKTFDYWYISGGSSYSKYTPSSNGAILNAKIRGASLYITYYVDGGTITSSTVHDSGTYTWKTDSSGLVYQNGVVFETIIDYETNTSTIELKRYNNPNYMNIEKYAYKAKSGAEWICFEGCVTENATFQHDGNESYEETAFCGNTNSDCHVKLKVNWVSNATVVNGNMYRVGTHNSLKRLAIYYVTKCDKSKGTCLYTSKYGISGSLASKDKIPDKKYGTSTNNNTGTGEIDESKLSSSYTGLGVETHTWWVKSTIWCRKYPNASDAYKKFDSGCHSMKFYLTGYDRLVDTTNVLYHFYWIPPGATSPSSGSASPNSNYSTGCYTQRTYVYGNKTDCTG